MKFEVSTRQINRYMVGKVRYFHEPPSTLTPEVIEKTISQKNKKIVRLDVYPTDICVLPNGQLLVASIYTTNFTIYDEDFKLIRIVNEIDNRKFTPYGVVCDNISKIYFNDGDSSSIIMTDLEFNKIKSYRALYPDAICFETNYIYAFKQHRDVMKLSAELELLKTIKINNYKSWMAKIVNDTLCIKTEDKLMFMNVETLEKKFTYRRMIYGQLSVINECFYEILYIDPKLHIYDKNGLLIKTISLRSTRNYIKSLWDGYMIYYNDYLVITSNNQKKLVAFETELGNLFGNRIRRLRLQS